MKYFVFVHEMYNDGTKDSPAIYTFESESEDGARKEAIASYHGKMSNGMKNSKISHILCQVIQSNGNTIRSEEWPQGAN